jgi:hypothetical protein
LTASEGGTWSQKALGINESVSPVFAYDGTSHRRHCIGDSRRGVLLLLLALASVVEPIPCKLEFAPLNSGTSSAETELDHWRKEEAGSWAGTNWIGWTHQSTRLVPARLIVQPLADNDDVFDEDRVTVEWRPRNLSYAVRCMPTVRVGRMESAPVVNHELDFAGPLEIALGTRRYTLQLEHSREDLTDARVILGDGTL